MYAKDVSTLTFFTVFFIMARLECFLGYKLVRILSGAMNNSNQANLNKKEFLVTGVNQM